MFVHVVTRVPVANAGILKSEGGVFDVPRRRKLLNTSASVKASSTPLVQPAVPMVHLHQRSPPRMPTPAMASVTTVLLKIHQDRRTLRQLPDLRPILPRARTREGRPLAQIRQREHHNKKRRVEGTPHPVAVVTAIRLRLILQPAILRLVPTMSVNNSKLRRTTNRSVTGVTTAVVAAHRPGPLAILLQLEFDSRTRLELLMQVLLVQTFYSIRMRGLGHTMWDIG